MNKYDHLPKPIKEGAIKFHGVDVSYKFYNCVLTEEQRMELFKLKCEAYEIWESCNE